MNLTKILMRVGIIFLFCGLLTACLKQPKPTVQPQQYPLPFEEAISTLANKLLAQIEADRTLLGRKDFTNIMIIPFADADTQEVPEISRDIEKIIIAEGKRNFKGFQITRLTFKNIKKADYIMNGYIRLDTYDSQATAKKQKYYRVYGEVRKPAGTEILGKSNVWISDQDLDYKPTAIYLDSPLYLKGRRLVETEKPRLFPRAVDLLSISLETKALLIEGRMAYESGDYETAAKLFALVAERKDGQDLSTYAGLYLANYKLGRLEEAEKAFAKVVSISVEKYRYLTVKYLFKVDSVLFLQDKNLSKRFEAWIRNIGKYFQNTDYCLLIVGHASNTGTKEYNDKLSLERAKTIQKRLQKYFPDVIQRSEVVGKGFSQNIVGIGTDDDRDALDRRVELFIIDCK
ncbi:OmpA family protein [Thermodesulfobacteriota bacterium]